MKKAIFVALAIGLMAGGLSGCSSLQKKETQLEKFERLILADLENIVLGPDDRATIESLEAAFQPQVITDMDEITMDKLDEPGRPYYFKLRALYKGTDEKAKRILLQDLGDVKQSALNDAIKFFKDILKEYT
jgi:hypothetical protein